jgi:hypothetical protein
MPLKALPLPTATIGGRDRLDCLDAGKLLRHPIRRIPLDKLGEAVQALGPRLDEQFSEAPPNDWAGLC